MSNSNRIAKNTFFLYIRMILILGVTLYTSRIVLEQLGISDYGIYSLVGGIVAMLGFFNAAMATSTQRYLAIDIGKNNFEDLKKTFSSAFIIHVGIALLILLLAETVGLWYINNVMVFPKNRVVAVNIVYQFSILTFILNVIQVPYNALIFARERMGIYAYVSILEAILKLIIVYVLVFFNDDKLIIFSILTFLVAFIIRAIYQIYCRKNFHESKISLNYDPIYFKELLFYSGWNLFGNLASIARNQGNNVVLNIFFGTMVNASYGLTMQVQSAVQMFINSFQNAVNPQITINYAKSNINGMQNLMLKSSKFSFFLTLILVVPILLNLDWLLKVWLGTPPEYTNIFISISLINISIDSLSGSLMTGIQATGRIKMYQLVVGSLVFLNMPLSFLFLKFSQFNSPWVIFIISGIISILSLLFRIYFLKKVINFNYLIFIRTVLLRVIIVSSLIVLILIKMRDIIDYNNFFSIFCYTILIVLILIGLIYFLGINKDEKMFFLSLKSKLIKK